MAYMLKVNKAAQHGENNGFQRMFMPHQLTLGITFPIEKFQGDQPSMQHQEQLARRAEALGYAALWFRDVPLRDAQASDVGQVFDPWVYLGWIAAHTQKIALATGTLLLPLRHPLHIAKAAASTDQLSDARFILGTSAGRRPAYFAAFAIDYGQRATLFRENFRVIRQVLTEEFPKLESSYGVLTGSADVVPKPKGWLPILVSGHAGQRLGWIAEHADGWITLPRGIGRQTAVAALWRTAVTRAAPGLFKPLSQFLTVDLTDNPGDPATLIHFGIRSGRNALTHHLELLRDLGINHVILNFRHGMRDAGDVLEEIGKEVLPLLKATSVRTPPWP
jgi:luciferase-type oxidoreductase